VIHLLADEGLRVRLSAAGQKVARNYSWESIAREMMGQYRQMLGAGGSGRQAR
jgi:glycosyltransferase involved in cell wall biosynthesis